MYYCDHCGEDDRVENMYPIEHLDVDVHSANKGESAVLCEDCYALYDADERLMKAFK